MLDVAYRLWIDDAPASQAQTDRVETITVDQEVDMAWEARLELPIGTGLDGRWSGEDEAMTLAFARVRVEVAVAGGPHVPLIDGPVVGVERRMSATPGESVASVRVHDDSVLLDREEIFRVYEEMLDSDVAAEVFSSASNIASSDVENTPAPPGPDAMVVVQRGTGMALLRHLALRHHKHAYVLPGDSPGASVGCFKSYPTAVEDLPDLVLTGRERNLDSFSVTEDALRPASFSGATIPRGLDDSSEAEGQLGAVAIMGPEPAYSDEGNTARRLLQPGGYGQIDPETAAQARTEHSTYAFEAQAEVLADRYPAVLTPYRAVRVRGTDGRHSGDYLITRVSHKLSRGSYQQSLGLLRNARSAGSGGGLSDLVGAIF